MANSKNIRGAKDGLNGGNDSYFVKGRGKVPRKIMVKEVLEDKHDGVEIYKRNNELYLRAKKDFDEFNNINKS